MESRGTSRKSALSDHLLTVNVGAWDFSQGEKRKILELGKQMSVRVMLSRIAEGVRSVGWCTAISPLCLTEKSHG